MAYEPGALEAALTAAVGEDPALLAELRAAFIAGVERQLDLLQRSRCDANWHFAAMRLRGLAASFGVNDMMDLADEALEGAPGDPVVLARMHRALKGMSQIVG